MTRPPNTIDDLLARIYHDRYGHWIWTGAINTHGYATVKWHHRMTHVHRIMYEHFKSEIPAGLVIDHLCRVRGCVNPDHLEAVTDGVNTARGELGFALTNHCVSGLHDITLPNAILIQSNGHRTCRECRNASKRRAYWREKTR